MNNIQFRKNYSTWIGSNYQVQQKSLKADIRKSSSIDTNSFSEILKNVRQGELTFSKHALQRVEARQIDLSQELMSRINSAVEKAKSKGIHDALMMGDNTAFIVNVPSSTVITIMNSGEMKENIFTNIDGAVIL